MNVVMYCIGALAVVIAIIGALAGLSDNRGLSAIYFYVAVSTGLSGAIFLGFGSMLTFLQQLVDNTRPLHDLFTNAKSRLAPEGGNAGVSPSDDSSEDVTYGMYEGYSWSQHPDGSVHTVMDDEKTKFKNAAEFKRFVRLKGPART
jgi:hypothetical protein